MRLGCVTAIYGVVKTNWYLEALCGEGVSLFGLSLLSELLAAFGAGEGALGRVSHIGGLVVVVIETLVNVRPRCGVAVLVRFM